MKVKFLLVLAFLHLSLYTIPCGNAYRHRENVEVYSKENKLGAFRFREKFDQSVLMRELQKIGDAIKTGLSIFEDENDRALTFMRVGEYDTALAILRRLELQKPNEYNIVANLGTLYELRGENEKALAYIRKAISIDTQSHHGTEWFHIQVLEAKLQKREPEWWKKHPVLNFSLVKKDPETIISDLTFQLKERLPFTPKPDLMMASILVQSADYLIQNSKQAHAWVLYKISMEYDTVNAFGQSAKLAELETYMSKNKIEVPLYASHYIKTEDLLETGKKLLERGIDYYNGEQEKAKAAEKKEKKNSTGLYLIGGSIIIILFLAFYSLRKKKNRV